MTCSIFANKTFLITGATGLIGKTLIERLLELNDSYNLEIKIIAVGRDNNKFKNRFSDIRDKEKIVFIEHDIQKPLMIEERIDYIVNLASNTHPKLYATDPIGTEITNIIGTYNLLELASLNKGCRFLLASSGDIYGDNIYNNDFLREEDCGYINCNTLRACYIEGKRASEALCNAFRESKQVDFVIGRLCRVFGKNMQLSDSKAISQFIVNAVNEKDIVLKSKGNQVFSYLHADDVVSAMLAILEKGNSSEAYNISSNDSIISLYNLANLIAEIAKVNVVFDLPDETEKKGASTFQNVKLDGTKLQKLQWSPKSDLKQGLTQTIEELKAIINKRV